MKALLAVTFALSSLASFGCATPPSPPGPHTAPPPFGTEIRVVELPVSPGPGEPREARVIVDEPALKLASIVLRNGTELPEHHSAVPVTIQSLNGNGTVVAGKERLKLDPGHAVVLAPNVPHSVIPEPGKDLVLLVHHLGRGEEHHH